MKEKKERNLKLLTDYRAGFKMSVLVERYGITRQRIHQIIKKMRETEIAE